VYTHPFLEGVLEVVKDSRVQRVVRVLNMKCKTAGGELICVHRYLLGVLSRLGGVGVCRLFGCSVGRYVVLCVAVQAKVHLWGIGRKALPFIILVILIEYQF